ncbi:hypothetical protein Taro_003542 [Colocasia esculenta]|uniref:Uncharacterized protein n=1 Tax=Colocasia esculenta TaxID=4460 RepID=A0A843TK05_COLES|nr:hypothetical protein [Colocasia esculenta]
MRASTLVTLIERVAYEMGLLYARVFVVLGVCPGACVVLLRSTGVRGKAVMCAAAADQARNDGLEGSASL